MKGVSREPSNPTTTARYAHLFQAFGDPTRLTLLQHLRAGEHRVVDLVKHLGFAQSTVSQHLRFLAECGLVALRIEGRSSWYSLTENVPLDRVIAAAEQVLEAVSGQTHSCTHVRPLHRTTR